MLRPAVWFFPRYVAAATTATSIAISFCSPVVRADTPTADAYVLPTSVNGTQPCTAPNSAEFTQHQRGVS
jgi:hypothetical protein